MDKYDYIDIEHVSIKLGDIRVLSYVLQIFHENMRRADEKSLALGEDEYIQLFSLIGGMIEDERCKLDEIAEYFMKQNRPTTV